MCTKRQNKQNQNATYQCSLVHFGHFVHILNAHIQRRNWTELTWFICRRTEQWTSSDVLL